MNEITINVVIADRTYTITINPKEEERIRKAAKDINEKTKNFSQMYEYNDNQDLLAMTALQISTENLENINKTETNEADLKEKIKDIAVLVDQYLCK